jgi:hypothetical protein
MTLVRTTVHLTVATALAGTLAGLGSAGSASAAPAPDDRYAGVVTRTGAASAAFDYDAYIAERKARFSLWRVQHPW